MNTGDIQINDVPDNVITGMITWAQHFKVIVYLMTNHDDHDNDNAAKAVDDRYSSRSFLPSFFLLTGQQERVISICSYGEEAEYIVQMLIDPGLRLPGANHFTVKCWDTYFSGKVSIADMKFNISTG